MRLKNNKASELVTSDIADITYSDDVQPRFIRRTEVQKITGLGASSIYQLQRDGDFPLAVQLSERRVAWIESEIQEWVKNRIAARAARKSNEVQA